MKEIWPPKGDESIQRIYSALLEALQTASDADECRGILSSLNMPYGNPACLREPSQRVKCTLASMALNERTHQIMKAANPQGQSPKQGD